MYRTLVFVLNLIVIRATDIPFYYPKCDVADPQLNQCIANAVNSLKPNLEKGISELSLLPLERFVISDIITFEGQHPNATFKEIIHNSILYNLHGYEILEARFDKNRLKLYLKLKYDEIPYILEVGHAEGYYLYLNLISPGTYNGTLNNVEINIEIHGDLVNQDGKDYYKVIVINCTMKVDEIKETIIGIFGEGEELANKWAAENPKLLADELTPVFVEIFEKAVYQYVDHFTKAIPFSSMFGVSEDDVDKNI